MTAVASARLAPSVSIQLCASVTVDGNCPILDGVIYSICGSLERESIAHLKRAYCVCIDLYLIHYASNANFMRISLSSVGIRHVCVSSSIAMGSKEETCITSDNNIGVNRYFSVHKL